MTTISTSFIEPLNPAVKELLLRDACSVSFPGSPVQDFIVGHNRSGVELIVLLARLDELITSLPQEKNEPKIALRRKQGMSCKLFFNLK